MADVRGACAIYYSYQVKDASGRITVPFRRRMAHSFVVGFAKLLNLKMAMREPQSITDTGGTGRTIPSINDMDTTQAASSNTFGLVVGTGTNAESINDTALQTVIAHGTGAGQLQYGASTVALPSSDSTSTSCILTRVFTNASGGTVTVTEIGVYTNTNDTGSAGRNICIVRDLATIALSNGDQLTLNYILKTTS